MVLAAGMATRMRPVSQIQPKALIEVAGKALIDHALDRLADVGVERAVVRGAVDPLRQPRDNDDPRLRARRRQLARDPRAVRRHATRAHDAHRPGSERQVMAIHPERIGR